MLMDQKSQTLLCVTRCRWLQIFLAHLRIFISRYTNLLIIIIIIILATLEYLSQTDAVRANFRV